MLKSASTDDATVRVPLALKNRVPSYMLPTVASAKKTEPKLLSVVARIIKKSDTEVKAKSRVRKLPTASLFSSKASTRKDRSLLVVKTDKNQDITPKSKVSLASTLDGYYTG